MLRFDAGMYKRLRRFGSTQALETKRDALLLTLVVGAATSLMILGIGHQFAPAFEAAAGRAQEIAELFDSLQQSSGRCAGFAADKEAKQQPMRKAGSSQWKEEP